MYFYSFKKFISIISLIVFVALGFFIYSVPCQAYTGSIAIFPALTGGPDHKTVSNIEINTEDHNPYWQTIDLNYVESVVIETDPPIKSHLLISEYPDGDSVAFSFTVPQPFQDALVSARVYFWGPDVTNLQIWHQHQGEPDTQLTAIRIEPTQRNANNQVLWYFTTDTFSNFFIKQMPPRVHTELPIFTIITLSIISLSALLVLKKN
jgi:hypothetical protein